MVQATVHRHYQLDLPEVALECPDNQSLFGPIKISAVTKRTAPVIVLMSCRCVDNSMVKELKSVSLEDKQSTVIYTCLLRGCDEKGNGSAESPYATLVHAIIQGHALSDCKCDPCECKSTGGGCCGSPTMATLPKGISFMLRKTDEEGFQEAPKTALKKAIGIIEIQERKARKAAERPITESAPKPTTDPADLVQLQLDPAMAAQAEYIKIKDCVSARQALKPVVVHLKGWVHRMRMQGKGMVFVTLRDGTGYLQCLLTGNQCKSAEMPRLTVESTISVYGRLEAVPAGKMAPGGHELQVLHWQLIHAAPSGEDAFETQLNKEANPDVPTTFVTWSCEERPPARF